MGLYKKKDSEIWYMSFVYEGKQLHRSTETIDKKEAQRRFDSIKGKIAEKKWFPESVQEEAKEYTFSELKVKYALWAEGRQKSWKGSRGYMAGQLDRYFGKYELSSFDVGLIEQFQTAELKRGLNPGGVNRLVGLLKSMFTKAADWEMIVEDVLKKVRKVKAIKGEQNRLRYLTLEEIIELVNACDPHLKPIAITALNTGMRRGEILKLRWEQVDLKHGFILLGINTKSGEKREIPINNTLRGTLQGLTRRLDVPYVFYDPTTGKPYKTTTKSFKAALSRAEVQECAKCDYQRAKSKATANSEQCPLCNSEMIVRKGITNFHFHDLRHTFASQLVMAGVDLTTVSKLLGHKSLTMTLRYAHLAPSHLTEGVKKLDNLMSAEPFSEEKRQTKYCKSIAAPNSLLTESPKML